jgi:hypothetical protein
MIKWRIPTDRQMITDNFYLRMILDQFIWVTERCDVECIWTFERMNEMTILAYDRNDKKGE